MLAHACGTTFGRPLKDCDEGAGGAITPDIGLTARAEKLYPPAIHSSASRNGFYSKMGALGSRSRQNSVENKHSFLTNERTSAL